jgi:general secretion pathway protein G
MACNRSGRIEITLTNALLFALIAAIVCAAGVPLIERASERAKTASLKQSLRMLRSQIELYKAEHGGQPPLLYDGSLPQLIRATNAAGFPGDPSGEYRYGPYLRNGIPVNPITGRSLITATDVFPPSAPSGNGGWLYHQQSGQIAVDLEEYIAE